MREKTFVKSLLMIVIVLVLATAASAYAQSGDSSTPNNPAPTTPATTDPTASQLPTLTITNSSGERVPVQVEIADTDAERQQGLMGRTSLAPDAGMLFVFDQEVTFPFWMKDTPIPLSVAFIDSGGRIVDIQDMQPFDETDHSPAAPYQYALEVNQGFFGEEGVGVGDTVELPGQNSNGS